MATISENSSSVFFAYGEIPHLRAETIQQAAATLAKRGHNSRTWQNLQIQDSVLIDKICRAIDSSDAVVAKVSDLNSNVLFEAGYALASNKHLWLALDETDADASRRWKQIGIFSTIGRADYSGSSDKLVSKWEGAKTESPEEPSLLETLMSR